MNLQIVTETLLVKRWVAASWAPIPLRLIVGMGFVAHGYAKLVKGPYVFVASAWRVFRLTFQNVPDCFEIIHATSASRKSRIATGVVNDGWLIG